MKYKVLYILIFVFFVNLALHAQRGIRIAYIDTEYILQNVPEYQEANAQLDKKVQEWKSEIDKKLSVIATKKQELEAERILLTKELYEERLEDIQIEENEVLDYQQKRFGPEGDYIAQKNQLVQPIQDQIFATVQEIAESRNYDFIFDKSADLTMLFSAKQYDVSEFVLRSITRSATRKQAQTKEERRAAEDEELVPEINTAKEERELALAEKQAAREKAIEDRRKQQLEEREAAKAAAEARRQQILEERAKAREAKLGNKSGGTNETTNKKEESTEKSAKELIEEQRAQKLKEREALRQKAVEAKQGTNPPALKEDSENKGEEKSDSTAVKETKTPQQLMEEERQRKLKEREEKRQAVLNTKKQESDSKTEEKNEKTADSTKAEKPMTAQEKMEAERQKKIQEREQRRKELEERKQKILEERKKQREQQEAEKKTDTTKNNN
jgi:Skp family chaperone for outer membrane proteins